MVVFEDELFPVGLDTGAEMALVDSGSRFGGLQ